MECNVKDREEFSAVVANTRNMGKCGSQFSNAFNGAKLKSSRLPGKSRCA